MKTNLWNIFHFRHERINEVSGFKYRQYLSGRNPNLRTKRRNKLNRWNTGHLVLKIFPFYAFKDDARKKRTNSRNLTELLRNRKNADNLNLWKISKVQKEQQEWKSAYGTPCNFSLPRLELGGSYPVEVLIQEVTKNQNSTKESQNKSPKDRN